MQQLLKQNHIVVYDVKEIAPKIAEIVLSHTENKLTAPPIYTGPVVDANSPMKVIL